MCSFVPLRPEKRRLSRKPALQLALLMALLLALLGVCRISSAAVPQARLFLTRQPTAAEVARRNTHARFEHPVGCYLGAYIDFDATLHQPYRDQNRTAHQDPSDFETTVGKAHAMYFFYMGYGRPLPVDWVRYLGAHHKFVHIALQPDSGLNKVKDDAYLRKLADDMARSGARIFLRFGSEMNGDWTNYHSDPPLYRKKFRLVYQVMHRRAPNVALVWCPYMSPTRNIPDYYPGDDATDWVGVNLYNVTYHNNQKSDYCEHEHPCDLLAYVYNRYAARKPIMICEFAASHFAAVEGRPRPDFARRKIATLYQALPRLFPRVKCINYFDSNNIHFVPRRPYNDYSVTDDPVVLATYRYVVSSPYYLSAPVPDGPQPPPPPMPMPLRKGELLRGRVVLSCWARSPSDLLTVIYKVDGYRIYKAYSPDMWDCIWDASSVRPGKHTISLEVLNSKGKVVASQKVVVQTAL